MREIKFRAWDKTREQMINVDMLLNTENGMQQYRVTRPMVNGCLDVEFVKEDTILMQYTGLKDKNGVDIYEGDIIELGKINEKIFAGVVIFNEDIFGVPCFCIQENEYTFHTFFDKDDDEKFWFEVIGSIYENPELLN